MEVFSNSMNSPGRVDHASQAEQAGSTHASQPRKWSRVEVEQLLDEYVRDSAPGERRLEAKTRMLACFDALNNKPPLQEGVELVLASLQLNKLPNDLSFLRGVPSINFSKNNLESLSESIGELSSLKFLQFGRNKIRNLPASIGRLAQLELLDAHDNQLQELPNSIGSLSALKSCGLSHNQLRTLPESMGSLSSLETLRLFDNQLQRLPQMSGSLSSLTELNLGLNQLQDISEWMQSLPALSFLRLSGNQLRNLPDSIGSLSNLRMLVVQSNQLSELPIGILHLPSNSHVSMEHNPLSQTCREQLQNAIVAHRVQHPHLGPQISFGMAASNLLVETKPLATEIDTWRREGGVQMPVQSGANAETRSPFETAMDKLLPEESEALSSQLGRIRVTAHYAKAPNDAVTRVNRVLDYMEKAPDVLQTCAAVALEGTETCDDRVALAFMELEEAIVHHQCLSLSQKGEMSRADLGALVEAASGLYKSQQLKELAQKKVATLVGFVDPTEIILKYVVKLGRELNLPSQLSDMIFHNCALQVTESDITNARLQITAKSTEANLNRYLAKWEPWTQALAKLHPREYTKAQNDISSAREELAEEMDKLTDQLSAAMGEHGALSTQYLDLIGQSNDLHTQYRNIETDKLAKLTEQVRTQIGGADHAAAF